MGPELGACRVTPAASALCPMSWSAQCSLGAVGAVGSPVAVGVLACLMSLTSIWWGDVMGAVGLALLALLCCSLHLQHLKAVRIAGPRSYAVVAGDKDNSEQGAVPTQLQRRGWLKKLVSAVLTPVRFKSGQDCLSGEETPSFRRCSIGSGRQSRQSTDGMRSSSSRQQVNSSVSPRKQVARGGAEAGRQWQPSMPRIVSGQHLPIAHDDDSSSVASTSMASQLHLYGCNSKHGLGSEQGCDLPLVPHMGHLAVDCMRFCTTDPLAVEVTQTLTTQHLLQFGALLGESSAELALSQAGAPGAEGPEASCLFGQSDNIQLWQQGWELIVKESVPERGVSYTAWRRYLRKNLYMYKSRSVFEGISAEQLAAFHMDLAHKTQWDESCTIINLLQPPCCCPLTPCPSPATSSPASARASIDAADMAASCGTSNQGQERPTSSRAGGHVRDLGIPLLDEELASCCAARSGYLYARTRFPPPMAQREYVYARRVWAKADDGGCYFLSRVAPHPAPSAPGCRVVRVKDFVAGMVIRESSAGRGQASEMINVYFEDSCVAAGIMNLGVRKALWPMVQKMNTALRLHVDAPRGAPALRVSRAALSAAVARGLGAPADGEAGEEAGSGLPTRRASLDLYRPLLAALQQQHGRDASGKDVAQRFTPGHDTAVAADLSGGSNNVGQGGGGMPLQRAVEQLLPSALCTAAMAVARGLWAMQKWLWTFQLWAAQQLSSLLPSSWLLAIRKCWRVIRPFIFRRLHLASHPVHLGGGRGARVALKGSDGGAGPSPGPSTGGGAGPGAAAPRGFRRWGRRLATRLALAVVRAAGPPLAHRVLSRSASCSERTGSHMGQHAGHNGHSLGTQASTRERTALVALWLHPEKDHRQPRLVEQQLALAQLQHQLLHGGVSHGMGNASNGSAGCATSSNGSAPLSRQNSGGSNSAGVPLNWDHPGRMDCTPVLVKPRPGSGNFKQEAQEQPRPRWAPSTEPPLRYR